MTIFVVLTIIAWQTVHIIPQTCCKITKDNQNNTNVEKIQLIMILDKENVQTTYVHFSIIIHSTFLGLTNTQKNKYFINKKLVPRKISLLFKLKEIHFQVIVNNGMLLIQRLTWT